MEKKTTLLIVGVILVILLLTLGINYFFNPKPVQYYPKDLPYRNLSEDMLITNQTLIDLIVNNATSPLGNNLTKRVLQDDYADKGIMDGVYKVAYYICTENEHRGWIYYSNGKIAKLYGPYEWCYA